MKHLLIAAVAAALLTGSAAAATPSAEQKAEFYKACVRNGGDASLCTCKAEAAVKLVDDEFMAVIITAMSGGSYDRKYDVPYNDYIVESTRACGMGM
jgi:opacity protein-like surface antigen